MTEQKLGRIAGLLYLIIIISGLFSEGFVRLGLIVPGNIFETAQNIMGSEMLFRMGLVSDLIMIAADIAVAVLFYTLLKSVNETLAIMAMLFRLAQASVIGLNLLNHFTPLLLLIQSDYLTSFTPEQLQALALLSLDSHKYGYVISQVFFSFNCGLMGYLVYKSKLFPNWLGIGIFLAGVAYLVDALTNFIAPAMVEALSVVLIVPILVEFTFCFWLIIKGTKKLNQ